MIYYDYPECQHEINVVWLGNNFVPAAISTQAIIYSAEFLQGVCCSKDCYTLIGIWDRFWLKCDTSFQSTFCHTPAIPMFSNFFYLKKNCHHSTLCKIQIEMLPYCIPDCIFRSCKINSFTSCVNSKNESRGSEVNIFWTFFLTCTPHIRFRFIEVCLKSSHQHWF